MARRAGVRLKPGALVAALGAVVAGLAACSAPDRGPCAAANRPSTVPLATSDGPVRALAAARAPVPGTDRSVLVVEGTLAEGMPAQLFVDLDGDRGTGMWTLQSSVSAAGWDLFVDTGGQAFRHAGAPNEWKWERLEGAEASVTRSGEAITACVADPAIAAAGGVEVMLSTERGSLPAAFLPGVAYPPAPDPAPATPPGEGPTASLAIQYSAEPWRVRGCGADGDVDCAAAAFGRFDHVVLGSGLEEPTHRSHAMATRLVAALRAEWPGTEVWGYVSAVGGPSVDGRRSRVHSVEEVARRSGWWQAMGATGVFLDEADLCDPRFQDCPLGPDGTEHGVDRAFQHAVTRAVHGLGLALFANAFSILDVLGPADGQPGILGPAVAGRPADMYLYENPTVSGGTLKAGLDAAVSAAKFELGRQWRARTGIRLAAVDTAAGPVPDDPGPESLYDVGRRRAATEGIDVYGFTNRSYSASPDLAPDLSFASVVAAAP